MSDEIGTYTFLPYLRQGFGNKVVAPTDPSVKRGEVTISLDISGEGLDDPPNQTVENKLGVYGPGDIVGIDSRAIVKTEPRNWITNFEPNYLPYIEFYDEDFPWRYTPAAASGDRLIPWLTLVVIEDGKFDEGKNILNKPLNYFTLKDDTGIDAVFPEAEDLWAWAHVHINRNIVGEGDDPVSDDETAFIGDFKDVLNENPDLAYSRIMCPMKLGPNTAYHAFLVPTFESGRLAGLGVDPTDITGFSANTIAWEGYETQQDNKSFPYYHRWYFRTSTVGDFEYLVRLLQPKVADSRVGHRDIDVQEPGSNIAGITDERLKGILRLGGALQVPTACLNEEQAAEYLNYHNWVDSYPHPFQEQLASFINLADDYKSKDTEQAHIDSALDIDDDPDPLITPPLYGRWHSLTSRLLRNVNNTPVANNDRWVHELNLDPRWRSAANFGTNVIQDKQEEYMDAAWEQVGDVLEANRRMRWARLANFASKVWFRRNIQPETGVAVEHYFKLTTPLHRRVMFGSKTVFYNVLSSRVPHALISPPMRRIVRPRGQLAKRIGFTSVARNDNFISRVNQGEVTPAPPRVVPEELPTHNEVAESARPGNAPDWLQNLLSRFPWIQYLPLVVAILVLLLFIAASVVGITLPPAVFGVFMAAIALYTYFRKIVRNIRTTETILPERQTPDAVDSYPTTPDFVVTDLGDPFIATPGETDSTEAENIKDALRDSFELIRDSEESGASPVYEQIDIPGIVDDITTELNPAITIPRYLLGHIRIPGWIDRGMVKNPAEEFEEALAYPEVDIPMYQPLLDISADHFVPNINLIEQNSITLLETNQRFIEAYMVGLNHEFSRELLWREFPTDQRGSYFRQFWDVSSYLNKDDLDEEALREKLRDIPPIHRWSRRSMLGDHDHREQGGEKDEEVVLVIRGELLKKYPTAVIYAHRARWQTDPNTGDRLLDEPRDFDDSEPMEVVIKTPLYEAKVDPDIYFFGFDLNVEEAKGGSGENDDDEAGWFFVIKERPGEPRFGLDVPGEVGDITVWNDLSWSHVVPDVEAGRFLSIAETDEYVVDPPANNDTTEKQQQLEDSHITWNSDMNAAELAYVLYQVPVLIGVHAAEMLPDKCDNTIEV